MSPRSLYSLNLKKMTKCTRKIRKISRPPSSRAARVACFIDRREEKKRERPVFNTKIDLAFAPFRLLILPGSVRPTRVPSGTRDSPARHCALRNRFTGRLHSSDHPSDKPCPRHGELHAAGRRHVRVRPRVRSSQRTRGTLARAVAVEERVSGVSRIAAKPKGDASTRRERRWTRTIKPGGGAESRNRP